MIISGCWVGYWAFLFFAMTSFAAVHPATLGWSTNTLQSSFGLIRFAFFLVSIFGSLLIASFFELWHTDNVVEAWAEFQQTPWLSAKKLLYMLLMIQAVRRAPPPTRQAKPPPQSRRGRAPHPATAHPFSLTLVPAAFRPAAQCLYLVYTIEEVDWALLLIIIAGYYLDAKKRNFMLMCAAPPSSPSPLSSLHTITHPPPAALPLFSPHHPPTHPPTASPHGAPMPPSRPASRRPPTHRRSLTAPLVSSSSPPPRDRYLVLVSVTLLLDVLKIAATPSALKTPGEAFGSFVFFLIFCLKFGIVGAIYMYQKQEDANPTAFAFSQMPDGAGRGEDEIAE